MRRWGWPAAWAAVAVLAVLAGSQWLLPPAFSSRVARVIGRAVEARAVEAVVYSFPALKLLAGEVDLLRVDARAARLGELRVSGLLLDAGGVRIDAGRLLRRGELAFQRVERLRATLYFSEEDLNAYLWATVDPQRLLKVRLERGRVHVSGRVPLLSLALKLDLEGRFVIEGPDAIRFVPERVAVEEAEIPRFLLDAFLREKLTVPLQLKGLPVPVHLTELRLEEGHLYLFAARDGQL
ncbi:MAG: DUF2993 domain-containing protein [Bacillota bacterium]|nr:DUF2993 domain-containing protein [Bacillota bacterium]